MIKKLLVGNFDIRDYLLSELLTQQKRNKAGSNNRALFTYINCFYSSDDVGRLLANELFLICYFPLFAILIALTYLLIFRTSLF